MANGGTIFLDEISEIPFHLQVKILHVMEQKQLNKVGNPTMTSVDVRIIAATNKDLAKMVKEGKFREDLYYRLNILPIVIPPLRLRKEDIPPLIHFFLQKQNKAYFTNKQLTPEAYDQLIAYDWPGNIRELENTIERLVITCNQGLIEGSHINNLLNVFQQDHPVEVKGLMPLYEALEQVETELLQRAYDEYKTTRKISEVLKIDQSTVVKKLQKLKGKIRKA